jgi:hypothetical protein
VNSIPSRRELLEHVLPVARAAGQAILDVFATEFTANIALIENG